MFVCVSEHMCVCVSEHMCVCVRDRVAMYINAHIVNLKWPELLHAFLFFNSSCRIEKDFEFRFILSIRISIRGTFDKTPTGDNYLERRALRSTLVRILFFPCFCFVDLPNRTTNLAGRPSRWLFCLFPTLFFANLSVNVL